MSRWTKPRSYSLKVPWPLAGCVDTGLGRRFSPSALRMRQRLSRLRCGRKWVMTNVRSSSAKLVTRRKVQTMALRLGCLPGQLVRPRRVVQAIGRTTLAPLAELLGGHAIALGKDAGALLGAGDLGAGDGRRAGVRMDLQHRSDLPLSGLDQTVEQVAIRDNSMPHRIPTMFRNLTPNTTLALWKPAEKSACGSAGNDKEPQAERTAWR